MALQTSGAISLNDIHVEAGGTTGTQASINDTDIRDLIGSTPGTQVSFSGFYGASALTLRWGYLREDSPTPSGYTEQIILGQEFDGTTTADSNLYALWTITAGRDASSTVAATNQSFVRRSADFSVISDYTWYSTQMTDFRDANRWQGIFCEIRGLVCFNPYTKDITSFRADSTSGDANNGGHRYFKALEHFPNGDSVSSVETNYPFLMHFDATEEIAYLGWTTYDRDFTQGITALAFDSNTDIEWANKVTTNSVTNSSQIVIQSNPAFTSFPGFKDRSSSSNRLVYYSHNAFSSSTTTSTAAYHHNRLLFIDISTADDVRNSATVDDTWHMNHLYSSDTAYGAAQNLLAWTQDSDGNIYSAYSQSAGSKSINYFITKHDNTGTHEWHKSLGPITNHQFIMTKAGKLYDLIAVQRHALSDDTAVPNDGYFTNSTFSGIIMEHKTDNTAPSQKANWRVEVNVSATASSGGADWRPVTFKQVLVDYYEKDYWIVCFSYRKASNDMSEGNHIGYIMLPNDLDDEFPTAGTSYSLGSYLRITKLASTDWVGSNSTFVQENSPDRTPSETYFGVAVDINTSSSSGWYQLVSPNVTWSGTGVNATFGKEPTTANGISDTTPAIDTNTSGDVS